MGNKTEKEEVKVAETVPKKVTKTFEATYTIPELVDASSQFGTNRVVVRAALSKAGKEAYTMKEAKQLIEEMKNKEVRA